LKKKKKILQSNQQGSAIVPVQKLGSHQGLLILKDDKGATNFCAGTFFYKGVHYANRHAMELLQQTGGYVLYPDVMVEVGGSEEDSFGNTIASPSLHPFQCDIENIEYAIVKDTPDMVAFKLQGFKAPPGHGSQIKTPSVGMRVNLYGWKNEGENGELKYHYVSSNGNIVDYDAKRGEIRYKCSTKASMCGGILVDCATGYIVGMHYAGTVEKGATVTPNFAQSFPLNY